METNNAQTRATGAKPTLMSSPKLSPAADEQAAEARILSNLKAEPLAHKPQSVASSGSGLKTVLLLGLVAVTGWGAYQYLFSGNAASQQATPRVAPPAAVVVAAAPAPPPVTEAAPAPTAAASDPQAAQIVDVPTQASASEPKASDDSRPAVAQEDTAKPSPSTSKKVASGEPKVKAKADAQAKAQPKAGNLAGSEGARAKAILAGDRVPVKGQAGSTNGAAPATDKDVNLLAALLAHTSATEAPAPSGASRQPAGMVKTGSAATAAAPPKSTVAATPSMPEKTVIAARSVDPKRDVVERQPAESTDTLLKRCKALGFFEGQLCRMRICSGLWETDAVCKASLTPNTASAPATSTPNNK